MSAPLKKVPSRQTMAPGSRSPVPDIAHTKSQDEKCILDKYEFGSKLGEGSFGVVHELINRETELRWACKVINKQKAGSPKLKLVEREVKILKLVRHEHIIQLQEVFETPQKIFLVMELCEGGELSKFVSKHTGGRLDEHETRIIMDRLASAISYLHNSGTVHRDLKLDNILLSKNPNDDHDNLYIKVTDFGLSVVKGAVGTDGMMDDYCGTPMYMAPEIVDNKTYSEKCDVWAMGIIMSVLLTGSPPFPNSADLNIDTRMKVKDWSHVGKAAKDCVSKMLLIDTAHRYTAREVLDHPFIQGRECDMSKRNVLDMMREFGTDKERQEEEENGSNDTSSDKTDQVACSNRTAASTGQLERKSSSGSEGARRTAKQSNQVTSRPTARVSVPSSVSSVRNGPLQKAPLHKAFSHSSLNENNSSSKKDILSSSPGATAFSTPHSNVPKNMSGLNVTARDKQTESVRERLQGTVSNPLTNASLANHKTSVPAPTKVARNGAKV